VIGPHNYPERYCRGLIIQANELFVAVTSSSPLKVAELPFQELGDVRCDPPCLTDPVDLDQCRRAAQPLNDKDGESGATTSPSFLSQPRRVV
jgi:hypothetical protein